MIKKLRTVFPICLIIVVAMFFCILNISSFAVGDEKSEGATESEEKFHEPADDFVVKLNVKESPEEIDEYSYLLNSDGYYDTGDSGYVLSEDERRIVECAVMCEAGGEGEKGEMMVAQSILDGALRNNLDVFEMIKAYNIATTSHSRVTDEVKMSVERVFDNGERVTMDKTDLWYNPAIVISLWHEEQQYVTTVGSHRFFWMNNDL